MAGVVGKFTKTGLLRVQNAAFSQVIIGKLLVIHIYGLNFNSFLNLYFSFVAV